MDRMNGELAQQGMMTEGVIWKQIVKFAIPLVAGNICQQLYSTVDSIVVGNFVGNAALAAVGASTPITTMIIGFFVGMATGAGVLVSNYFGANRDEDLSETIHSAAGLSIIGGGLLTIIGYFLAPMILGLMDTPQDVFDNANAYLKIYFSGVLFVMIYNMGAGILRAVGDSKRPLWFLCISAVVNIVLDLWFVVGLGLGVSGVGYATVVAQAVSAFLVTYTLIKTKEIYRLNPRKIALKKDKLIKIVKLGLPSGIQQSIIGLSNTIVQSKINLFGSVAMAGSNICSKIDGFLMMPIMALSLSATTFAGQNIGAGKLDRVKKGNRVHMAMMCGYVIVGGSLVFCAREFLVKIFSQEPEVWDYATLNMAYMLVGYLFLGISQQIAGTLKGAGKTVITMLVCTGCWCGLRVLWMQVMLQYINRIEIVYLGYPLSWLISAIILLIYYYKAKWYEYKM